MKPTPERSMGASLKSPEKAHFPSPLLTNRASVRMHVGRQIFPTSEFSALPVDSQLPHLYGNGPYLREFALAKRGAQAAERSERAPRCPVAAGLSLSPRCPALLVNHRTSGGIVQDGAMGLRGSVANRRVRSRRPPLLGAAWLLKSYRHRIRRMAIR